MGVALDKTLQRRVLIGYGILFSLNSFFTCFIAAFTGSDWRYLSLQQVCLIIAAFLANWTGIILALLKNPVKKIIEGQPVSLDTDFTTKPKEQET